MASCMSLKIFVLSLGLKGPDSRSYCMWRHIDIPNEETGGILETRNGKDWLEKCQQGADNRNEREQHYETIY